MILCESCRYGAKEYYSYENQIKGKYVWCCTRTILHDVLMDRNECELYERRIERGW